MLGEAWTVRERGPPDRCDRLVERGPLLDELLERARGAQEVRVAFPLPLGQLGPQRLHVGEMVVHRAHRDPGLRRDLGHARPQSSCFVTGEQCVDDGLAVAFPPLYPTVGHRHEPILH